MDERRKSEREREGEDRREGYVTLSCEILPLLLFASLLQEGTHSLIPPSDNTSTQSLDCALLLLGVSKGFVDHKHFVLQVTP